MAGDILLQVTPTIKQGTIEEALRKENPILNINKVQFKGQAKEVKVDAVIGKLKNESSFQAMLNSLGLKSKDVLNMKPTFDEKNALVGLRVLYKDVDGLNTRIKQLQYNIDKTGNFKTKTSTVFNLAQDEKNLNNIKTSLSKLKNDASNLKLKGFDTTAIEKSISNLEKAKNSISSKRLDARTFDISQVQQGINELEKTMARVGNMSLNPAKVNAEIDNIANKLRQNNKNVDIKITAKDEATGVVEKFKATVTGADNKIREIKYSLSGNGSSSMFKGVTTDITNVNKDMTTALGLLKQIQSLNGKLETKNPNSSGYKDIANQLTVAKNALSQFVAGQKNLNSSQLTKMTTDLKNLDVQMGNMGRTQSQTAGGMRDMLTYATTTFVLFRGIMQVKKGLGELVELDSAVVNLKKVSDELNSTNTQKYVADMNAVAKSVGHSTVSAIDATASFKKLGETLTASKLLAKESLILSNIGDVDQEQATKSIISVMSAYKLKANEVRGEYMDKANYVGNNFAIDLEGITEATTRSISILKQGGNSMNEVLAMYAGANKEIQNPEKIGTALKTISMRMRGTADEDGEVISTYREQLLSLANIDIMKDNKTFKSTAQMIKELSKVYKTLPDVNQARITELVAGKHHGSVLSALLNNIEDFDAVTEQLGNGDHVGSAMKEQERYMDSASAKINNMKESLVGFWNKILDSNGLKGFLDMFTAIGSAVGSLGSVFGNLNVVLAPALALLLGFTRGGQTIVGMFASMATGVGKLVSSGKGLGGLLSTISNIGNNKTSSLANNISNGLQMTDVAPRRSVPVVATPSAVNASTSALTRNANAVRQVGDASSSTSKMTSGLASGLKTMGVAIAISLIATAITNYKQKVAEAKAKTDEFIKSYGENLKKNKDDIQELNSLEDRFNFFQEKIRSTGSTKSFSTDELSEYNTMVDTLLEMSPGLQTYYDETGTKVVDLTTKLQDLNSEKEKEIENDRKKLIDTGKEKQKDIKDKATGKNDWNIFSENKSLNSKRDNVAHELKQQQQDLDRYKDLKKKLDAIKKDGGTDADFRDTLQFAEKGKLGSTKGLNKYISDTKEDINKLKKEQEGFKKEWQDILKENNYYEILDANITDSAEKYDWDSGYKKNISEISKTLIDDNIMDFGIEEKFRKEVNKLNDMDLTSLSDAKAKLKKEFNDSFDIGEVKNNALISDTLLKKQVNGEQYDKFKNTLTSLVKGAKVPLDEAGQDLMSGFYTNLGKDVPPDLFDNLGKGGIATLNQLAQISEETADIVANSMNAVDKDGRLNMDSFSDMIIGDLKNGMSSEDISKAIDDFVNNTLGLDIDLGDIDVMVGRIKISNESGLKVEHVDKAFENMKSAVDNGLKSVTETEKDHILTINPDLEVIFDEDNQIIGSKVREIFDKLPKEQQDLLINLGFKIDVNAGEADAVKQVGSVAKRIEDKIKNNKQLKSEWKVVSNLSIEDLDETGLADFKKNIEKNFPEIIELAERLGINWQDMVKLINQTKFAPLGKEFKAPNVSEFVKGVQDAKNKLGKDGVFTGLLPNVIKSDQTLALDFAIENVEYNKKGKAVNVDAIKNGYANYLTQELNYDPIKVQEALVEFDKVRIMDKVNIDPSEFNKIENKVNQLLGGEGKKTFQKKQVEFLQEVAPSLKIKEGKTYSQGQFQKLIDGLPKSEREAVFDIIPKFKMDNQINNIAKEIEGITSKSEAQAKQWFDLSKMDLNSPEGIDRLKTEFPQVITLAEQLGITYQEAVEKINNSKITPLTDRFETPDWDLELGYREQRANEVGDPNVNNFDAKGGIVEVAKTSFIIKKGEVVNYGALVTGMETELRDKMNATPLEIQTAKANLATIALTASNPNIDQTSLTTLNQKISALMSGAKDIKLTDAEQKIAVELGLDFKLKDGKLSKAELDKKVGSLVKKAKTGDLKSADKLQVLLDWTPVLKEGSLANVLAKTKAEITNGGKSIQKEWSKFSKLKKIDGANLDEFKEKFPAIIELSGQTGISVENLVSLINGQSTATGTNELNKVKDSADKVKSSAGVAKGVVGALADSINRLKSKEISVVVRKSVIGDSMNTLETGGLGLGASLFGIGNQWTGSDNFKGGLSWVGERGRELIVYPDNTVDMANKEEIRNMPKGTKIYNNADTEKIMKQNGKSLQGFASGNTSLRDGLSANTNSFLKTIYQSVSSGQIIGYAPKGEAPEINSYHQLEKILDNINKSMDLLEKKAKITKSDKQRLAYEKELLQLYEAKQKNIHSLANSYRNEMAGLHQYLSNNGFAFDGGAWDDNANIINPDKLKSSSKEVEEAFKKWEEYRYNLIPTAQKDWWDLEDQRVTLKAEMDERQISNELDKINKWLDREGSKLKDIELELQLTSKSFDTAKYEQIFREQIFALRTIAWANAQSIKTLEEQLDLYKDNVEQTERLNEEITSFKQKLKETTIQIREMAMELAKLSLDNAGERFDLDHSILQFEIDMRFEDDPNINGFIEKQILNKRNEIEYLKNQIANIHFNNPDLDDNQILELVRELQSRLREVLVEGFELEKKLHQETIKSAEDKLSKLSDIEKRIIEVIKKRIENEKKLLDDNLKAYKEYMQEKIDILNKEDKEIDYQTQLQNEQDALQKMQKLANEYMLDDSVEARNKERQLREDIIKQQEKIEELQRKHRKDAEIDNINDLIKQEEKRVEREHELLDEQLKNENLYMEARRALLSGFMQDVDGAWVSLETALIDFENKFGEGMSIMGDKIKAELIENIKIAQTEIMNLAQLIADTMNKGSSGKGNFDSDFDSKESTDTDPDKRQDVLDKAYKDIEALQKEYMRFYDANSHDMNFIRESQANGYLSELHKKANEIRAKYNILDQNVIGYPDNKALVEGAKQTIGMYQQQYMDFVAKNDPLTVEREQKTGGILYQLNKKAQELRNKYGLPYENLIGYRASASYATGGLITNDGIANVHGSKMKPELVLNNTQAGALWNFTQSLLSGDVVGANGNKNIQIDMPIYIDTVTKDTLQDVQNGFKGALSELAKELKKDGIKI